ncbi:MAG: SAM-dependent methyltransferase [Candidatus Thermoplasmatota archaeon]|nr:SAM-dependent methyltransferase [Candidatus Thermoplasmatota archaeon]
MTFDKTVSSMSIVNASARARESRRRDCLISDPYAEKLSVDVDHDLLSKLGDIFVETVVITSRFFDDAISVFLSEGVTQVVVLGAGMDSRPYRLKELRNSSVKWIEVDFKPVLDYKEEKLSGDVPLCTLHRIGTNILKPGMFDALAGIGWSNSIPTLWVIEGVFHYLAEDQVRTVLLGIRENSASGSGILFSAVSDGSLSHTNKLLETRDLLRSRGSPMTFFLNSPKEFVASLGFSGIDIKFLGHSDLHFGRLPWPPSEVPPAGFTTQWYIKAFVP